MLRAALVIACERRGDDVSKHGRRRGFRQYSQARILLAQLGREASTRMDEKQDSLLCQRRNHGPDIPIGQIDIQDGRFDAIFFDYRQRFPNGDGRTENNPTGILVRIGQIEGDESSSSTISTRRPQS